MADKDNEKPVVIKKYANRRLYNTESSSYVTLDNLAELVKEGRDFVVRDAKTSEDITRSVLTQIIFEQESKGQTLLPVPFLRQLISLYGDGLQAMVPSYLQASMESFVQNQEQFREMVKSSMNPGQAFAAFDELTRKNMAMMEKAMSVFTPFSARAGEEGAVAPSDDATRMAELEKQLADVKRQLDTMAKD